MPRRVFSIVLLVCKLLILNNSLRCVAAEGVGCSCTAPEAQFYRPAWLEQPALREENMRVVINRLKSYFRRGSPLSEDVNVPVVIAEGVGEVFVHGDDISTDGVTVVEGSVPITGSVTFSGPVRASGTVTIAGMCAPASGRSNLRIGQPLLPRSRSLPLPLLRGSAAEVPPRPERVPAPACEILPIEEIAPIPTVILPSLILPTIPSYVLPEVSLPADFYELGSGVGEIVVTGEDIPVCGTTYVDGIVPTVGEVSFGGYVPATGTVTVSSNF